MTTDTGVPKFFRPLANITGFTFFICIYAFFSGFFSIYTVSQLTSIAKQFNMAIARSGFLVSSSEFGFIIVTILTGHFFSRSHRPRILFAMGCINGLSCIVAAIPYFVDMNYDPKTASFQANDTGVCDVTRVVRKCQYKANQEREKMGEMAFGIFLLATILAGFATSGVWTIGVTYLDDNCDPKKSSFYLGILFFVRLLSPVGALLSGAGFSALPLHLRDNGLTPDDRRWVGAWWLGYFIIGVINVIIGIPLIFFPKDLRSTPTENGDAIRSVDDVHKSRGSVVKSTDHLQVTDDSPTCVELCKDLPRVIARLLCNPILFFACVGMAIQTAAFVSYYALVPMYLEVYFKITAYTANIITGVAAAGAVALGVLISGWIISKVKFSLKRIAAFATLCDFTVTLLFLATLAISCSNPLVAGVNTPGIDNLTQSCNLACNCDDAVFNPVCASDGISYRSPCHAGCGDLNETGMYKNCACVEKGAGTAHRGTCGKTCEDSVIIYSILLFIISCVPSGASMTIFMIILRCTKDEDKSMAVAMLNFMTSSAILPLPVIFGTIVQTACLVYSSVCGGGRGYCLFYDNQQLKFLLHIITFATKLLTPLFYALGLFFARGITFAGDELLKEIETQQNIESDNETNEKGRDNFGIYYYGEILETQV